MNENDRGMVKWAPFNSVVPSKQIIASLEKKRSKVTKPILSSDQINNINTVVLDSYHNHNKVLIKYYDSGYIFLKSGLISTISSVDKNLVLDQKYSIYFSQILSVKALG